MNSVYTERIEMIVVPCKTSSCSKTLYYLYITKYAAADP